MNLKVQEEHYQNEDNHLVRLAIEGNLQAFNALLKKWYKRIYNFSLKFLGGHDEAMEVTQQTFIKAYESISKLKEESRFKSWLYVIAGNLCRDAYRKSKKLVTEEEGVRESETYYLPEHDFYRAEMAELLKKALLQIPEEQRLVIIMKEFEGFKFHEIAEALKESENTIKSRMYYGLKSLKKILIKWKIDKEAFNYEL